MKRFLIYLLIIMLILTGCSTTRKKFIFTGESDTWNVEYTVDVAEKTSYKNKKTEYSNKVDRVLEITLKDNKIKYKEVKNMKFKLKSYSREASGDINFQGQNTKGSIFIKSSQIDAAHENENDKIDVIIFWNDKKDNISLKLKK